MTRSILSSRARLAKLAGITFKGGRDLYTALGYPDAVAPEMLMARYFRQDICSRIANAYPDAMWSRAPVPGPDMEGRHAIKLRAAQRRMKLRKAREKIEQAAAKEAADRQHEVAMAQAEKGSGEPGTSPFGKPPGKGGGFGGKRTAFARNGFVPDDRRVNETGGLERERGVGDNGGPAMDPNDEVAQAKAEIAEYNAPEYALQRKFEEICKNVRLWHYVSRADRLAGVGRYAVLLLGFNDVRASEDLSRPAEGATELNYVQAYSQMNADVTRYVTNPADEAFGLPELYQLRLTDTVSNNRLVHVHRSRIVHVAEGLMDGEVEGSPVLERVLNRVLDLEKIVGGAAEMFWLNARHGIHINVDKDIKIPPEAAVEMQAEVQDYVDQLSRFIRTRGSEVNVLGSSAVDPAGAYQVVMNAIAITTGIPVNILMGVATAATASEQDRTNWAVRIEERRKVYAEPVILDQLVSKLIDAGVLPDLGWEWAWPDAFPMSPLERAQTSAQQAAAAASLASTLNILPEVLTEPEVRGIVFATNMTAVTAQTNELEKEGSFVKIAAAAAAAGSGAPVSGTAGNGGMPRDKGPNDGIGLSGRKSRGGDGFPSDTKKYSERSRGSEGGKTTGRVDALTK